MSKKFDSETLKRLTVSQVRILREACEKLIDMYQNPSDKYICPLCEATKKMRNSDFQSCGICTWMIFEGIGCGTYMWSVGKYPTLSKGFRGTIYQFVLRYPIVKHNRIAQLKRWIRILKTYEQTTEG